MRGVVWNGSVDVTDALEVRDPGPNEVRVQVAYAGVCHSDLSVVNGTIAFPTPVVLGHEGAGTVDAVGSAVTSVSVGDHVVLHTLTACGVCRACARGRPTHCTATLGNVSQPFSYHGEPAYSFANAAVFSEYTVVHETQAVPIADNVPLQAACLIGCAVMTGAGAAMKRARVEPGSTAVVFGAGGIGLSAVQGARIAGATTIIVIDSNPEKEHLAKAMGATHFIGRDGVDGAAEIRDLCPAGVDFAFECVGSAALSRACVEALDWGGTAVLVGTTPADAEVSFLSRDLWLDKNLLGCRYGSAQPHFDIPTYLDLYRTGALMLDQMVTNIYPMEQVERAFADMSTATIARNVLAIGAPVP